VALRPVLGAPILDNALIVLQIERRAFEMVAVTGELAPSLPFDFCGCAAEGGVLVRVDQRLEYLPAESR
jgi:hypothetical protein